MGAAGQLRVSRDGRYSLMILMSIIKLKKKTIGFDRFVSFLQLRTSGVYDVGHIARGVYL